MKRFLTFLILSCGVWGAKAEENSILYPQQIQRKLSAREQCQLDEQWKQHYGSLRECVEEKRHDEILMGQRKLEKRMEAHAAEAAQVEKRASEERREDRNWQGLRETVHDLTHHSR